MSKLKWFWDNLLKALFNDKEGFSMRKCIAVVFAKVTLVLELANTTPDNIITIAIINGSFIALLLGIVTIQNLIELKKS